MRFGGGKMVSHGGIGGTTSYGWKRRRNFERGERGVEREGSPGGTCSGGVHFGEELDKGLSNLKGEVSTHKKGSIGELASAMRNSKLSTASSRVGRDGFYLGNLGIKGRTWMTQLNRV